MRGFCAGAGLHIGIHTSSAVNNAEIAPFVGEAVDTYLRQNVELAAAGVRVGHRARGLPLRGRAPPAGGAVARIQRLHEVAAEKKVPLWFENHNKEPERAEIHYLPHNVEEHCFPDLPEPLDSPWFRWSFNAAHAHLVPEGIPGSWTPSASRAWPRCA